MKKTVSVLTGAAMLLSYSAPMAFAEDTPTPADLPEAVYEQLLEHEKATGESDGILTEEEFSGSSYISLNLDGIDSIDFLSRLKAPRYIYLQNGNITDFSLLSKFKGVETLQLSNMPQVTDISFAKGMDLAKFYINSLEQITDEQKTEIMKFHDADTSVGFSDMIGATPVGMFDYDKLTIEIADTSIASYDTMLSKPVYASASGVYGKKAGTTEYTLYLDGTEIHKGSITVKDTVPETLPQMPEMSEPEVFASYTYSPDSLLLLRDNTLYCLKNGSMAVVSENVKDYDIDNGYDDKGNFTAFETILHSDGTVEINGKKPANAEGLSFSTIGRDCCITDSGDVYCIRQEGESYMLDLIYHGFSSFPENSTMYFIDDKGEVILNELKRKGDVTVSYQSFRTGITDIISSYGNYFIDSSNVLWEVRRRVGGQPTVSKRAEDVVFIGYKNYSGNTYGCVHITSDGKAYMAGSTIRVFLDDEPEEPADYKDASHFVFHRNNVVVGYQLSSVPNYNYHVTNDNVICLDYNGKRAAFSGVKRYIDATEDPVTGSVFAYFLSENNNVYSYSFADQKCSPAEISDVQKIVPGDVNNDGRLTVADVILLQNWLLNVPGTELQNWKAADLCEDNKLDSFDLCLMKQELTAE